MFFVLVNLQHLQFERSYFYFALRKARALIELKTTPIELNNNL